MGEIDVNCRPPSWLERIWYRRLGMTPPLSTGSSSRVNGNLLRLVPYSWRWFHRLVADRLGFYWLPCPLCGVDFGGHEQGESIPDPARPPHGGIAICSRCTITRNQEKRALLSEVYQAYWDVHPRDRDWSVWRISQEHWDVMQGEGVAHLLDGSQLWLMGYPVEIRPGPAEFVREEEG